MVICVRPRRHVAQTLPALEVIRQRAAAVRRRWSEQECERRRVQARQMQFLLGLVRCD